MIFNNNFAGNQNQLPWPAHELVSEPYTVDLNNPPFVPTVTCTPDFQQLLPLISGSAVNAIANQAKRSSLRAFLYNQLSENNYRNNDFIDAVTTITTYMMYLVYVQRQNLPLTELVQVGVEKGLEYKIANNVATYQGLVNFIDAQTRNSINGVLNELQQLKGQFQQMLAQLTGNVGTSNIGIGVGGMQSNRPSFSSGNFGTGQSSNAIFQNNPITQPVQQVVDTGVSFGSKYGNIKPTEVLPISQPIVTQTNTLTPTQPQPPIQVTETIPTKEKQTVRIPLSRSGLKWVRSDEQPYPPIVKRSVNELYVNENEDSTLVFSIGERSKESMFEYETHTTQTNFGIRPSARELPTKEQIDASNRKLIGVLENGVEKISESTEYIPPSKVLSPDEISVEFSLESIVIEHEIKRDRYVNDGEVEEINIFRNEVVLLESLGKLSDKDYLTLERLQQSETFEELVTRLRSASTTLSKKAWRVIERRLTRIFNDVLSLYLSMDIKIDSYLIDIDGLLTLLNEKYVAVYDVLMHNQLNIIRFAIKPLLGAPQEPEIRVAIESGDGEDNKFEFLASYVTMTSIDIDSELLDIELTSHVGNVILSNQSKLLYSLAESIFKERNSTNPIHLDYLMLSDGVVLRISKGLVGGDYYCVSVVN